MHKGMFARLAASNLRKNSRTTLPYLISCIVTITMYDLITSLSRNPDLLEISGGDVLAQILTFGRWIVAIFAVIFLFYTNSFLVRRRKKEFGLLNILGLDKRHLAKMLAWETLFLTLISLAAGLALGVAMDKLLFLVLTRIIGQDASLGFFLDPGVLSHTALLFAIVFLVIYCNSVLQIRIAKPVDLLRGDKLGEKEPKSKWVLAILGVLSLGAGYFISFTTRNPLSSITMFFLAVLLVIAGTYLLFTAGSITLLKFLRHRPAYYYQTRHFISVSGLLYRMKRNAVGLANICILSTMALVMLCSTTVLQIGMEDIIQVRFPADFSVYGFVDHAGDAERQVEPVRQLQQETGLQVESQLLYPYLIFSGVQQGDEIALTGDFGYSSVNAMVNLIFVPISSFPELEAQYPDLQPGQAVVYSNRTKFDQPELQLGDDTFTVVGTADQLTMAGSVAADIASSHYFLVSDPQQLDELWQYKQQLLGEDSLGIRYLYCFDTSADKTAQLDFYSQLQQKNRDLDTPWNLECRTASRQDMYSLYGGLFFIGLFLSVLFLMGAVLIIYYKQISEGYEDRERFDILQKVGMSRAEVRATIRSQVLTVFFLPLVAAGVHMLAAFPILSQLLAVLNMYNTRLYLLCTAAVFAVFALLYVLIYAWTAKAYYRIVSPTQRSR